MRHDEEEEEEGVCLSTSSDKRPRLENCLHSWPLEEGKNGNKERRTVGLGLVRTSYNCWVSETVVKNFTPTKAEVVHFRVKSRERGELDKKLTGFGIGIKPQVRREGDKPLSSENYVEIACQRHRVIRGQLNCRGSKNEEMMILLEVNNAGQALGDFKFEVQHFL